MFNRQFIKFLKKMYVSVVLINSLVIQTSYVRLQHIIHAFRNEICLLILNNAVLITVLQLSKISLSYLIQFIFPRITKEDALISDASSCHKSEIL